MFPRWLSWLVIGMLAYLVVKTTAPTPPHPESSAPAEKAASTTTPSYPELSNALDLERWKKAVNPKYAERTERCRYPRDDKSLPLTWVEETAGTGDGARCSDTIAVKLTVWNARGNAATYTGISELTLGEKRIAVGLDEALVGIRVGGKRTVTLPPAALGRDKKAPIVKPLLTALPPDKVAVVTVERLR